MKKLDQTKTPYLDALKKYVSQDVLPLDVPGHHMGNVQNKFKTLSVKNFIDAILMPQLEWTI